MQHEDYCNRHGGIVEDSVRNDREEDEGEAGGDDEEEEEVQVQTEIQGQRRCKDEDDIARKWNLGDDSSCSAGYNFVVQLFEYYSYILGTSAHLYRLDPELRRVQDESVPVYSTDMWVDVSNRSASARLSGLDIQVRRLGGRSECELVGYEEDVFPRPTPDWEEYKDAAAAAALIPGTKKPVLQCWWY